MTENQGNSGLVSLGQLMPLIAVYNKSSKVTPLCEYLCAD